MAFQPHVYKSPQETPLLSTISSGCQTPILEVKFCSLVNPFRYPNSPTIPRYSITCVFDVKKNREFIEGIRSIEQDEKVDSILKNEPVKRGTEGTPGDRMLIKFQGKEKAPVYIINANGEQEPIQLEDELAPGEKVIVLYDILRYTKKGTAEIEHGLSFKLCSVLYFPSTALAKEGRINGED